MTPTAERDAEPLWLKFARAEVGQREVAGPKANARILDYFAATHLHPSDDDVAWCSAFVNWCVLQAGIEPTHKANARSWLGWGKLLKEPRIGAITVLWRGTGPAQGHVAFYIGETQERLLLLGGNQGNAVAMGVYPKSRLLGYRWPLEELPRPAA